MYAAYRRWSAAVLLSAASLAAAGEPESTFRFRSETPAVRLEAGEDGRQRVAIDGFDTHPRRPGTPDVPWKTVLVAIPPGSEPRLGVTAPGAVETIAAVVPQPVVTIVPLGPADESAGPLGDTRFETVARADPSAYAGARTWPPAAAWLGRRGVLRDQAYVELHLAPVRFDTEAGALLRDPVLEVTIDFGAPPGALREPSPDPRFEPVYRRAFVNYEQGRTFRLSGGGSGPRPVAPATRFEPAGGGETPVRRIVVREDGIVRLDHALFLAEAPEFLGYDLANWRLTSRGVQVPLQIEQSGVDPAALEAGEWIQFYGQGLDDEPEQVLNYDTGGLEDLYEVRDYSDENVYFLTVAGAPQPTMTERPASPGLFAPPADFPDTTHVEVNDVYFPLAGAGLEYWLPLLSESATTRSEFVPLPDLASTTAAASVRVSLRGVSQCDGLSPDHASRVELHNDLAETLVLPPGNPDNSGNQNLATFDGQTVWVHDFDWTHSGIDPELSDPLEVVMQVDELPGNCPTGGILRNDVLLDWIEVDYRRSFVAGGDRLSFAYPDGDADFTIVGMTSGAADIEVYEITAEIGQSGIADAVRLTGVEVLPDSGSFTVRFHMADDPGLPGGTLRRFVVSGVGAVSTPAPSDFRADRVSLLAQDTTAADLIVVAHPDLLVSQCSLGGNPCDYDVDCTASDADRCEIDPASTLGSFLAHRASQGISSRVARIGDIEDEFNDGLAGPLGIRNLVQWALTGGWDGPPPAYLLLLGDATYLPKNPTSAGNYVPTQVMIKQSPILAFYASDNLLGDAIGDDHLTDMMVGRISARTQAEADTVLQKVLDYEQMPPVGAWHANALFISDAANNYQVFEGQEFERINEIGVDALAGTAYTTQNLRYWSDYCEPSVWTCTLGMNVCTSPADCAGGADYCQPNCDTQAMRDDIKDAINGISGPGTSLVQYMGHGNFDVWSSDGLFCGNEAACGQDDTLMLTNGLALPWLIVHNCLSGGFHSLPPKSLGEQWLKRTGGGAAAVFAPSGLGFRFLGEGVTEVIWDDLFGATKERSLGVPVMDSLVRLCSQDSIEGCQFYTLLGDPSMTLVLPDVAPAESPAAIGDNGVVHLSWTASATPGATYDVYRTKQLLPPYTLPYQKINAAPIAVPSFDDPNVSNLQNYYYYVVAVDPDGFESRWSNFNTDCQFVNPDCQVVSPQCPVVGPDCLVAVPINLVPPATPTGLAVADAESGGRLNVNWHSNPEDDIDFYTVHYGTTTALGQTKPAYTNQVGVNGLQNGVTYYVAVSATNTSGVTSGMSPTLEGVPSLVLGVRSPELIGDLLLGRAGDDAELTWGAVTEDIYGKPTTVAQYEVFRGSTMQFVPSPATLVGSTATTSYVDGGELAGGPTRYYLVRALDDEDNPGGLGRQLPMGTAALVVGRSSLTPGNVVLGWPAVTTDFDGNPTTIVGYEVYASDQPFDREDIQSGATGPPLWSGPGNSCELTPAAQSRFYSVLVIDVRGNRSPF